MTTPASHNEYCLSRKQRGEKGCFCGWAVNSQRPTVNCNDPRCPDYGSYTPHPHPDDSLTPASPRPSHTEIHGPDGELIILPESPLEIVKRVTAYDSLRAVNAELLLILEDVNNFGADDSRLRDRMRNLLKRAGEA